MGRLRRRPSALLADRGYDSKAHRQALRTLGIRPLIARRKTTHDSGLGSQRWVVERTLSWLRQHRRLRIRYERQAEIHEAFLSLARCLICLRALRGSFCYYDPASGHVLRFGQIWTPLALWRCVNRSTGLTCTNRAGHGFWLGRLRGSRLF